MKTIVLTMILLAFTTSVYAQSLLRNPGDKTDSWNLMETKQERFYRESAQSALDFERERSLLRQSIPEHKHEREIPTTIKDYYWQHSLDGMRGK